MRFLFLILFFVNIDSVCIAQSENMKGFNGDSCNYKLYIWSNNRFSYSKTETIDFDKELNIEKPIISIKNGDTLRLSSNDIVEVDELIAGNWKLINDTIILSDTIWPKESINRKIYFVIKLNDYSLQNINLPKCKPNSVLYLTYYFDKNDNWIFWGKIKNGIINGEKRIKDSNENVIFEKNYNNEIFSENEFLNK
jgi:hypothetical protein